MFLKKVLLISLFLGYLAPSQAQLFLDPSAKKVGSIDAIITELYRVNSGKPGFERNWGDFKYLFYPNAKIIPTGTSLDGNHLAKYLSTDAYKNTSATWLKEEGYIEKEIHRKMDVFGNMAHVFSTFEVYHTENDPAPAMRGIKSIQLLNDGIRWWIVNLYWSLETPKKPIPSDYLPK
ncbi:hypothetical protein ACFSQP_10065 [Bizionia sediminis]|uniref:Nuclear transport factor 2 family protein n=1 Tax=Bizionia sediminis TaxID=1737064 RepID=A0ABW5KW67_9FLAO